MCRSHVKDTRSKVPLLKDSDALPPFALVSTLEPSDSVCAKSARAHQKHNLEMTISVGNFSI